MSTPDQRRRPTGASAAGVPPGRGAPPGDRIRSTNELVGLLTLPFLVFGAATGSVVWLLLELSLSTAAALIAVHAYTGLIGAALVVTKTGVGLVAWLRRARTARGKRPAPSQHLLTGALVLVVVALYGSGLAMYANVTPGGATTYKNVHLWSALLGVPLVSHHLWRFLRRASNVVRNTLVTAPEQGLTLSRRHALLAGGLGLLGFGALRASSSAAASLQGNDPNDFPVTLTSGGADQPRPDAWRMRVRGDVAEDVTVSLDDLRRGPVERHRYSLDCVLGWSATRTWGGVPLRHLVEKARPNGEFISVVVRSTTGYEVALLRATVEDSRTLVAFEVDGVDLSAEHGFPARIMAPGVIGERCLKWIDTVTVVRG